MDETREEGKLRKGNKSRVLFLPLSHGAGQKSRSNTHSDAQRLPPPSSRQQSRDYAQQHSRKLISLQRTTATTASSDNSSPAPQSSGALAMSDSMSPWLRKAAEKYADVHGDLLGQQLSGERLQLLSVGPFNSLFASASSHLSPRTGHRQPGSRGDVDRNGRQTALDQRPLSSEPHQCFQRVRSSLYRARRD